MYLRSFSLQASVISENTIQAEKTADARTEFNYR